MANLDLRRAGKGLFGPLLWAVIAAALFGFLWTRAGPPPVIAEQMRAAGPDGATAYFRSPEAAVAQINQLLAERNWMRLARYYDFTGSAVTPREITSGSYFLGEVAVPPEPAGPRPFPQGYRFLYAEASELPGIVRVVVTARAVGEAAEAGTDETSFLMARSPEGYRIVPVRPATSAGTPGDVVP